MFIPLFVNDNWRVNDNLTLNLGVRLDKNDATDGDGDTVGDDASFSPRLSAIWDPEADGRWAISGSYARYTMALTSNLAGLDRRSRQPGDVPVDLPGPGDQRWRPISDTRFFPGDD